MFSNICNNLLIIFFKKTSFLQCHKDLKKNTRKKASKIKASQNKTGGGPPTSTTLSALDNAILDIGGRGSLDGLPLPESQINFLSIYCIITIKIVHT